MNKEIPANLVLYNTLTKKKEKFVPITPKFVKLYTCGLTVYNFAHIGNLRTYIFEDVLKRVLLYNGYKIKHVMNITDVGHLTSDADTGEDKMVLEARKEKKSVWEIAEFYTNAFEKDLRRLNIIFPDYHVKATDNIEDMINLIKKIEKKGYTYISNGNVYFDISKDKNYGKLSGLNLANQKAGARTKIDTAKKNPFDFVLWFTKSKFDNQEMKWDSPWGKGYPGWHIECSTISLKYLGCPFDIHCGGIDHIPIHHTNEIAQNEAAEGKKCVNYWLHSEFLIFQKHKMSKSRNEFLTLDLIDEKGYSPLVYKFFCLGAHYRQKLNFSYEALDTAKASYNNLQSKIIEIISEKEQSKPNDQYIRKVRNDFLSAINKDLNTPKALAVIWNVIKTNKIGNREKYQLIINFDRVFGLDLRYVEKRMKKRMKRKIDTNLVKRLIKEREEARETKNWEKSDRIRERLRSMGIEIRDKVDGTSWRLKK